MLLKMVSQEVRIEHFVTKIDIKEMMYLAAESWDSVTTSTVRNCWRKGFKFLFPNNATNNSSQPEDISELLEEPSELVNLSDLLHELNIDSPAADAWLQCDNSEPTFEMLSDESIVALVTQTSTTYNGTGEDSPKDDDDNGVVIPVPTAAEAIKGIETAILYFESKPNNFAKLLMMKRLISDIKLQNQPKQKRITDF